MTKKLIVTAVALHLAVWLIVPALQGWGFWEPTPLWYGRWSIGVWLPILAIVGYVTYRHIPATPPTTPKGRTP